MPVTAKYTPPVPAKGEVTVTMDEDTAQKLRALLGRTTTGTFYALEAELNDCLPRGSKLFLNLGKQPPAEGQPAAIFLDPEYGVKFEPFGR